MQRIMGILVFIFMSGFLGAVERTGSNLHPNYIEKLYNKPYYLKARKDQNDTIVHQALSRFDLIFVGHTIDIKNKVYRNIAAIIPGHFTHVLAYIGKDKFGVAYAIEMNGDKDLKPVLRDGEFNIDANLRLVCLNETKKSLCPLGSALKRYDYMWAKRFIPELESKLMQNEDKIMESINRDLVRGYVFALPLKITIQTLSSKKIPLVEYHHNDGADCVSYFVTLFEETAHICFKNIRIDAAELMEYYLKDPIGQKALLLAKYNPISDKDIPIRNLFENEGFVIFDSTEGKSVCSSTKKNRGVPTPDKLFRSEKMMDVPFVKKYDRDNHDFK